MKITLREQKISEAKYFYKILSNPNFKYFTARPISVAAEQKWMKQNPTKINFQYNYSIIFKDQIVGGCGIKINQHRKHIGEIGYFVDEAHWGKGIAPIAVKLLEKIAFKELKLRRIEILTHPNNKASKRVAVKCGYHKEGTLKKVIEHKKGFWDAHIYAKVR